MTSTTDMAGHPDVTEISDLTEGLLSPSRSADVRQHLDDCPLCADVYDSLEEIRGLLGTLPGPLRMPADVAGRIDAALAAEALLSATAPATAGAGSLFSADPSYGGAEDSGHVSRETSLTTDRPAGHSRGTTGPGRTHRPRRGRRRTVVLGAMFTAAALGLGGLLIHSLGSDGSDNDSASASPKPTDSAETFAGRKLDSQVEDLLAKAATKEQRGPRSAQPNGTESGESPSVLNLPTNSVPICIKQGIGRDAEPLASKEGSYKGTDAYLVVLPAATDTTRVTAYVVDSACVENSSITAGKVLLEHSYPLN
ncbi:hypothetical protein QFZ75_003893 [Streptomyces sp. V3I8]|uniref:anti-sigma factor family protein n=1 Tax=Streptomyces sp. V3I8 TaxID=3042279 RepID=UPI00278B8776|nr:hypothetical protein [Streptomyces sp. V3I8]MDQ1037477.1 hypothetical protein [Streptomyces sp. V3I8]